jgi:hypothetical protein
MLKFKISILNSEPYWTFFEPFYRTLKDFIFYLSGVRFPYGLLKEKFIIEFFLFLCTKSLLFNWLLQQNKTSIFHAKKSYLIYFFFKMRLKLLNNGF